ncbi:energy transducer TonB [Methylomonas sp. EbA]|uniref:Energy transducer TonB n=2 Tax=Methylomonas albis TaxID=1854563 RepID=A0ABR9D7D1_9GAMM|nr:energy transducer TonB [Methylomonas albis]
MFFPVRTAVALGRINLQYPAKFESRLILYSTVYMYLFKNHEDALQNNELASFGGYLPTVASGHGSFWQTLLGEERPSSMLRLLALLVFLLHLWGLQQLLKPEEKVTPAQPLTMEVSMIAISAPKPSVAPPPPAPPPPEKKPPPKKPEPKPVPKKAPPIVQKAPEYAPVEPVSEPQPTPVTSTASSTSVTSTTTSTTATNAEQFTEANFRANYAHNPKPEYPMIAKSRGWQGKVMLRVQVSPEGLSDSVAVERSSGHEMLDESAVEAVKKWKFIPAKRGETPVASSVIVPIIFTLRE